MLLHMLRDLAPQNRIALFDRPWRLDDKCFGNLAFAV
jgi:hypothetical protein